MVAARSASVLPERGLNSIAPSLANAIFCPAATFGAPHTTRAVSPPPIAAVTSRSLSALGCGSTPNTSPTTSLSLSQSAPSRSTSPTSLPAIVSLCANSSAGRSTAT